MHLPRSLAALGVVAAALGSFAAPPSASAQQLTEDELVAQFGGYEVLGRSNGFQYTYDLEGVFPLPSPLFQMSMPEAVTTASSGATSALGSLAYPGNVVADLPSVLAQAEGGDQAAPFVPRYPVRADANYPAGPPEASQGAAGAQSDVRASLSFAQASTRYGGNDLPGFLSLGNVTTDGQSQLLVGMTEGRGRAEVSDISFLGGFLTIESITTDVVASSDGEAAGAEGTTQVSGARLLGRPVSITSAGVAFTEPPPDDPPPGGPAGPIVTQLPGIPTGDLAPAVNPVNAVLTELFGSSQATAGEVLAGAGISVQVFEPVVAVDGSSASILANGVVISIDYDGQTAPVLSELLAAVPAESLPSDSPTGTSFNSSPQALFNLLREHHFNSVAFAYAAASTIATPSFTFTPPQRPATPAAPPVVVAGGTSPSFSTPSPSLSTGSGRTPAASPAGSVPLDGVPAAFLGPALPILAVVLALGVCPFFAIGSSRLADNVLNEASSSCPLGLDGPIDQGTP